MVGKLVHPTEAEKAALQGNIVRKRYRKTPYNSACIGGGPYRSAFRRHAPPPNSIRLQHGLGKQFCMGSTAAIHIYRTMPLRLAGIDVVRTCR